MAFTDYGNYDALGLAELVRRRQVTPAELVEAAIARAERVNPRLGAIVISSVRGRGRRGGAPPNGRGRGCGPPWRACRSWSRICTPTSRGRRHQRAAAFWHGPQGRSAMRRWSPRFRRAGLVIFGRTDAPELGLLPVTEPEAHGPTHNPWNPERTAGGSSGGSAAAVAARHRPHRPRQRRRRFAADPVVVLRSVRPEADARAHPRRPRPGAVLEQLRDLGRHHAQRCATARRC